MSESPTAIFSANRVPTRYHLGTFDSRYKNSSGVSVSVPSTKTRSQLSFISVENHSGLSSGISSGAVSHFDLENGSTSSDSTSSDHSISKISKPETRRNLCIMLGVAALCLAIAGAIAAASYANENRKINTPETVDPQQTETVQPFTGFLRVNETFESRMSDTRSEEFHNFEERFCSNVVPLVSLNVSEARCEINNLSPGSIVVSFRLEVLTNSTVNVTQHLLTQLFNVTQVGVVPIFPGANFSAPPQTSDNKNFSLEVQNTSSCSEGSLPILPRSYTYPRYCGEYQVCVQGKAEYKKCPEGQEFSFLSSSDVTVCAQPSKATYCGIKANGLTTEPPENYTTSVENASTTNVYYVSTVSMSQASLPTTSPLSTITTSVSTQVVTPATTTVLASLSSSSATTTTTTTITTDLPPQFTCPSSGYHNIPAVDTYPSNCIKYQECVNGRSFDRQCAEGTHFVYSSRVEYICNYSYDPLTFCNRMKAGFDITTFTTAAGYGSLNNISVLAILLQLSVWWLFQCMA